MEAMVITRRRVAMQGDSPQEGPVLNSARRKLTSSSRHCRDRPRNNANATPEHVKKNNLFKNSTAINRSARSYKKSKKQESSKTNHQIPFTYQGNRCVAR